MRFTLLFCLAIQLMAGKALAQNILNAYNTGDDLLALQTRLEDAYSNTEGTPYLSKEWLPGTIYFSNNSQLPDVPLRFNLYENYLEVKLKGKVYQANLDYVTSFFYQDQTGKWVFKRVELDKKNNAFVRIILEDKVTLGANYIVKLIKGTKQESGYDVISHAKDKFSHVTIYYLIFEKSQPVKIPRGEKAFLKKLGDQKGELKSYLEKNNLDTRKDEDLIKAITYYNSLL